MDLWTTYGLLWTMTILSHKRFSVRPMRTVAFLVPSLLLMVAASFAADDQKTLAERTMLISQLRRCLEELPAAGDAGVTSPCGGKDVRILSGIQVDVLVKELGEPTWCAAADGLNKCKSSKRWGWSFYRLPKNSVGGGPELVCELDETKKCFAMRWVVTE
jgi:hypothetical protein